VNTRNEGIKVTGKIGYSKPPMIEHFKFVAAHTKVTPKITIPAPSALYGRPTPTPIDRTVYPDNDAMFHDLGQAYTKGRPRVRRRGLPLPAARRGVHRDAVRREVSSADASIAATIRKGSARSTAI
jgi:methionine synthase II (cobalamin-independent)